MLKINIIPITATDIETLVHLSRKTFYESFHHMNTPENMKAYMDKAFEPQRLIAELMNPLSEFYFIKANEKAAGFLKINQSDAQSDLHDNLSLEIERIYIDAQYQGKNLGAKLIEKAKERASELQMHYIWLGVWEKNTNAIRFYERHGFTIFNSHAFQMGDELQTDILMRCETV